MTKAKKNHSCLGCLVVIVLCFAGFVGIAAVLQNYGGEIKTSRQNDDGTYTISGKDYFGCVDRSDYDALTKLAIQKDIAAYSTMIRTLEATGKGVQFSSGQTVHLESTGLGVIQVRPAGSLQKYWTAMESIQR